MKDRLIYITERITFQDIKDNKISKIEVYEKQMHNWFIKPAQLLADNSKNPNNYELELSLLTLLITFFESHGQYLLGQSSRNGSKNVFIHGFKAYLEYLVNFKKHKAEYYSNIDLDKFYTLVRCGLLHNGYIKTDGISFFIDKYKMDKLHVIYPNSIIEGSWLINTFNMLGEIKDYLTYFINYVYSNEESRRKFEQMFNVFFSID